MIRIGYMSDIHLEFERNREYVGSEQWYALRDARKAVRGHPQFGPLLAEIAGAIDVMILAGDIDTGAKGVFYGEQVARFLGVPVAYVAGNHEHYGQLSYAETIADLREGAGLTGIHFLERDRLDLVVAGERLAVLGATLWTDYAVTLPDDVAGNMYQAKALVSDHEQIHVSGREWLPEDALAEHQVTRAWLEREIPRARDEADAVLVVTHHAPAREAVYGSPRLANIEWAYASAMENLVAQVGRGTWIYGHTHDDLRFDVAGVPVVTAARGYVSRTFGWDFRPGIVEV